MPVLSPNFAAIRAVDTVDLDNDGDADIVLASDDGQIVWYENVDGTGTFGAKTSIAQNALSDYDNLLIEDIDGDGDLDILAQRPGDWYVVWYENRRMGDSNDDGIFNSSDLIQALTAGKYEDGISNNATFDEGDWNQDGDFDSADLIVAFQAGHYTAVAAQFESQIAAAADWIFATDNDGVKKGRSHCAEFG